MEWTRGFLSMVVVVVLITVTEAVYGQPQDCCSYGDRTMIMEYWTNIWGRGDTRRRALIAREIFEDVFQKYPEARELFRRVRIDEPEGGEFQSHLVRVINGIDIIVNLLMNPYILSEQLAHLGEKHEVLPGMRKVYFEEMVRSVAKVFSRVDSCFNVASWNRCFEKFVIVMSAYIPP
jgi:hypothetical protein